MYILKHHNGDYVAQPGQRHQYTKDLHKARLYYSKQAALNDRAVTEQVISFEEERESKR